MDPGVAPWYAESASTDCWDVRKGEALVVVQVVEDLVVRGAKGAVVGGFEGSQNDECEGRMDCEATRSHYAQPAGAVSRVRSAGSEI